MSHLLWIQHSRSAYSSTSTKCPTCCEYNTAEVHTVTQVQNVPPAVNTTQQKCLQQHKYKMSHLLWIQHSRSAYSNTSTKCPACCEYNQAMGATQHTDGKALTQSWLTCSWAFLWASALQAWAAFPPAPCHSRRSRSLPASGWPASSGSSSVSAASPGQERINTVKQSLYSNMLSIHTVGVSERERERERLCVSVCDCVCVYVCMCMCACVCIYAWMLHIEIMYVWICVAVCIVCYLYVKHFQPQNQLFKNCPLFLLW